MTYQMPKRKTRKLGGTDESCLNETKPDGTIYFIP